MIELLTAVLVYTIIYGTDYLVYLHNKATYSYVSRRTFVLFFMGQVVLSFLFLDRFEPYFDGILSESFFLVILLLVMMAFSYVLTRERLFVCHTTSRTESCLTPGYVFIKGNDIQFQQMAYIAVALTVADLLPHSLSAYVVYAIILLLMHTPVILSMNRMSAKRLTAGILVISAPIFYVFTEFDVFWPAVYLHTMLYVVLWMTLADWDVEPSKVEN